MRTHGVVIIEAQFDMSRRGKIGLQASMKKQQGTNRTREGGRRACCATPPLSYDYLLSYNTGGKENITAKTMNR